MAKSISELLEEAKEFDRIYIKWLDADISYPGWEEVDLQKELVADGMAETNGFYMGHDKVWLVVMFSISRSQRHKNVTARIPIKWVYELELG